MYYLLQQLVDSLLLASVSQQQQSLVISLQQLFLMTSLQQQLCSSVFEQNPSFFLIKLNMFSPPLII
jgi:hypothetical protein